MNDTHCKISAATLARTAALALALTNQVLSACGKPMLPIESATVEQLVTTGLTVTAALVNWWKNNSFTPEAIKAEGYKIVTPVLICNPDTFKDVKSVAGETVSAGDVLLHLETK